MRVIYLTLFVCLFALSCANNSTQKEITMETLLKEMVSRDQITRFPDPYWESLQASSYNRESLSPEKAGWFADSDGVGYIRTEQNNGVTEYVMMEDFGAGCITKIWAVCFYYGMDDLTGGNIRIYLDGAEEPVINENFFELVKGYSFAKAPLADSSARAGNLYMPITYSKSCKVTHDKQSFYNIINYRSYPEGTKVETFNMSLLDKYKNTIDSVSGVLNQKNAVITGDKITKNLLVGAAENVTIILPEGANAIYGLNVKLSAEDQDQALRSTVMSASFDKEETIWCPVGDFFANGVGNYEYSMWERSVDANGNMECRWVMPYQKNGELKFTNYGDKTVNIEIEIVTNSYAWDSSSMYFHSNWRMDKPIPTFPLFDWNVLEVEGQGVFVGDHITVLNPKEGWWGEGDEKIYVDNEDFPSHFGTGTEDYYGWAGGVVPTSNDEFSKPFVANIKVADPLSMGYNTCSRTRSLDAIPFKTKFKFDLESSCGTRQSWFHLTYAMTSFWYAKPNATHNRENLVEMAKQKIMTLKELQDYNEKSKNSVYTIDNAIEAENLTFKIDPSVKEIKDGEVWGELSGGKMQLFQTNKQNETITVRLTEQFSNADIQICAAIGPLFGEYEIWVNGVKKMTHNFVSGHSGVSNPYVELKDCAPLDNYFEIEFKSTSDKASHLGIDCFILNI